MTLKEQQKISLLGAPNFNHVLIKSAPLTSRLQFSLFYNSYVRTSLIFMIVRILPSHIMETDLFNTACTWLKVGVTNKMVCAVF
jgi:hypothetical protein